MAENIDNRIKFFEVSAGDKKIKLERFISPNVPKVALFDTDRIKEVLNNLLSNALKFTKANEVVSILAFAHNVGVSVESEIKKIKFNLPAPLPEEIFAKFPNSLVVVVSHPDEGIPKEQIGELFNKFKQLNNKEFISNVKGTGLGLAIVKGIIEEHKGHVGAVSEIGIGSAFYFVLPLLTAEKV